MPHGIAVIDQVYQVLTRAAENSNFIMAGDWNTAYLAKERCTGELQRPADEEHAQILQALQMQPTDEGLEYTSRQHPFYAEGQQQQHSRIDDFTWSKILQTGIRLPLALDTYDSKPNKAADSWHKEISEVVGLHKGKTCASFQQHFPPAPECPCDATWKQWAQTCASEMSRAKAVQREAQKAHDQQSIENRKKTQSSFMRNQKKTHRMILGKGSQHSLGAV
ncbi:MAG: hypothetical protein FRX49_07880 [Trebouxia sp. A1-2]|nr:MAG: hypothetical protein FRX49_07880 [Trebouxia sp. A1-2]